MEELRGSAAKPSPNHSGGAFDWQKERRKPGVPPGKPITGFGPGGAYTLWLTTPEITKRVVFENGKPKIQASGPAIDDPELRTLRERLISTVSVVASGRIDTLILRTDLTLLEYASALINRHYNVSDEDLAFLLPIEGSPKWAEPIVIHAIGGPESRDALASIGGIPMPQPAKTVEMVDNIPDLGKPAPLDD